MKQENSNSNRMECDINMTEFLNADVGLTEIPKNGYEAYNMVVVSLAMEIKEKTEILTEMLDEDVKQQFIKQWHPNITNVNIHV